mmetsp:Transcript_332/g.927  ORF Transcript_332/g.927 Transcript_332/m.927 type:complete len:341 (-) Transcript_332:1705-2727(-)
MVQDWARCKRKTVTRILCGLCATPKSPSIPRVTGLPSSFWMRPRIDVHQSCGIHRRIGLGRRQRRVPQQLLNRPQIAASVQQMRGEAVAHCMWCGAGGQAQLHPRLCHGFLDRTGAKCAAPHTAKQRTMRRQIIGARGHIGLHSIASGVNHRHNPFLAPLAHDPQHLRQGCIGPGQGQRLGNPQAAAPKQCQHGSITGADPRPDRLQRCDLQQVARRLFRQRARQLFGEFRCTGREDGRRLKPFARRQPFVKRLDRRQLARQRPGPDTPRPRPGHPGAHVLRGNPRERTHPLGLARMGGHKAQEFGDVARIGRDRIVRRPLDAALMRQKHLQRVTSGRGN